MGIIFIQMNSKYHNNIFLSFIKELRQIITVQN